MQIVVKRRWFTNDTTIGEMSIDNTFECYTLEDKDRNLSDSMSLGDINKIKIFGKTAIPTGTYKVTVEATGIVVNVGQRPGPPGAKKLPLIIPIKGFSGVRIHVGNNATATEGCLLVGQGRIKDAITNSTAALNSVFDQIETAINAGQSVSITFEQDIIEDFRSTDSSSTQPSEQSSTTQGSNTSVPNTTDEQGNSPSSPDSTAPNSDTSTLSTDFSKTFEQIDRNLANIEAGDVQVSWGMKQAGEDANWIGLKQFLIYLATRYTPQSVFPFLELIPRIKVEQTSNTKTSTDAYSAGGYIRDGKVPSDVDQKLKNSEKNEDKKLLERLKFLTELPPGFNEERFNVGADALNKASGNVDLFTIDPFQEGIAGMGIPSDSGKAVLKERSVGVRVYGQLVLTPAPIPGAPSKPGAVGFTDLEIQAGSQSDNGLALISLKLLDVQGNKFTDINSPWAFIFDSRPGSIGGDFYFRYGWQVRVPDPFDKEDMQSKRFWNHPGWLIFPQQIKEEIKKQILPGKQIITLTQCLNTGPSTENPTSGSKSVVSRLDLFDEGVVFDETTNEVKVKRNPESLLTNYTLCSILNPELSIDEHGATIATLNMRTAGAITALMPLMYAITTRKLLQLGKKISLGDLILAVENDMANFGLLTLKTDEDKQRQEDFKSIIDRTYKRATDPGRQFPEVFIVGLEEGGNTGTIHPDDIPMDIPNKLQKQILYPDKKESITLIRWFRQVLQENESELQSAATGSGAGINATWIISTTKKIDQTTVNIRKQKEEQAGDSHATLVDYLSTEQDVFAYRFQGSLVENMIVEKTEAPNAMKVEADFAVGDFLTDESESKSADDILKEVSRPTTAADRKRNLMVVFSQMQNINIDAICHPWIGPGKRFQVKGMGFYDGEYLCLSVVHNLSGHKFTSKIEGARILVVDEDDKKKQVDDWNKANGQNSKTGKVTAQQPLSKTAKTPEQINDIILQKTSELQAQKEKAKQKTPPQGGK